MSRLPKYIYPPWRKHFANPDLGRFITHFDNAIENQGYNIEYQYHITCPCVSMNTMSGWTIEGGIGSPNPVCPTCKGTGKAYIETINTKAIIHSIIQRPREYTEAGRIELGTIMVTPKSEIKLNYFDRLRLVDEEFVVNELISSNTEHIYILQHNPLTIKKVLMYIPNIQDPKTSIVQELIFNEDFTVDLAKSTITLKLSSYPSKYNLSVLYLGNPWFYIIDVIHHARGRRIKLKEPEEKWYSLPRQGLAKRGDIIKI